MEKVKEDCRGLQLWYSRTSTNGQLSTTATFFGGQFIHSLLFETLYSDHFLLPQGVRCGEVQLYLNTC